MARIAGVEFAESRAGVRETVDSGDAGPEVGPTIDWDTDPGA
jgi:hypothetical protein